MGAIQFPSWPYGTHKIHSKEALTAWRKAQGFIKPPPVLTKRQRRAAREEMRAKRKIWEMWAEQGLPITDPDALYYLALQRVRERVKNGQTMLSWTLTDEARKIARGAALPAAYEEKAREFASNFDSVIERRRKFRPYVAEKIDYRERLDLTVKQAMSKAYAAAQFSHKGSLVLVTSVLQSQASWYGPTATLNDSTYKRRISSRVMLAVKSDWARTVGLARANLFGPRTLVLEMRETPSGTKITLLTQTPHRYAFKIKDGRLARDAKGEPIFVENKS